MEYIIESTKTNAGTRKLPMTDDVAQCFRAIIEDTGQNFTNSFTNIAEKNMRKYRKI